MREGGLLSDDGSCLANSISGEKRNTRKAWEILV
jgi:hypothetical protein